MKNAMQNQPLTTFQEILPDVVNIIAGSYAPIVHLTGPFNKDRLLKELQNAETLPQIYDVLLEYCMNDRAAQAWVRIIEPIYYASH